MNTNEYQDNMDSTSNFQSAEEESKLTSNQSQNSTNNNISENDEIFYDIVKLTTTQGSSMIQLKWIQMILLFQLSWAHIPSTHQIQEK